MESSISDTVIARFLERLQESTPHGEQLAEGLRVLFDGDSPVREDALIDLYRRLADGRS